LSGEYKGFDTPTEHYCLIHNLTWNLSPNNALHGNGCKQCGRERVGNAFRKPVEFYIEELSIKNPDIKLLGDYINNRTPVSHYCKKHNVVFDISPMSVLRGGGCKQCASEKLRESLLKPEDQYVAELQNVHHHIILCDKYVGSSINTLHKCLICGCEWSPKPSNLLTGYGCPCCNQSKGEKQIQNWLEANNIVHIAQKRFDDCKDKRRLPFDFYLPTLKICIEYQGMQHYEAIDYFGGEANLLYTQKHDKIKSEYCIKNNIWLMCIPYWKDITEYLNKNLLI
jgi:hypothetical protein